MMKIDNTFKYLKIVADMESRNAKRIPKSRRARNYYERFTIWSRNLNSNIVRTNGQSSTMLTFVKSRHQIGQSENYPEIIHRKGTDPLRCIYLHETNFTRFIPHSLQ